MASIRSFKEAILGLSDRQLDPSMRPLIEKWDDPPTALQILEPLDWCIHGSLASGFVINMLHVLYEVALTREGKTHEEMEPLAVWRKEIEGR